MGFAEMPMYKVAYSGSASTIKNVMGEYLLNNKKKADRHCFGWLFSILRSNYGKENRKSPIM